MLANTASYVFRVESHSYGRHHDLPLQDHRETRRERRARANIAILGRSRLSGRVGGVVRRVIVVLMSSLLALLGIEAVLSVGFFLFSSIPCDHLWVFEETHRTIHFDPVLGYRLTQVPSRYARITYGKVEYVGRKVGNAQGFPDRDDFSIQATSTGGRRFAVLGDSFTAGTYLERNWPDHVEDLAREGGRPIELFNFSNGGGGLANWWSVVLLHIEPRGYQFDGIIFAVWGNDLHRTFTIADHRGTKRPMLGRLPRWDPTTYPRTIEEARAFLRPLNGYIVTSREFELALQGEWCPPRQLELYVAPTAYRAARDLWRRAGRHPMSGKPSPKRRPRFILGEPQRRLVEDIRRYADTHELPILVVSVPSRKQLLKRGASFGAPADVRRFAKLLGAELIDGSRAFEGLSIGGVRAHWLPYDAHWADKGSDRFGNFMAQVLEKWP